MYAAPSNASPGSSASSGAKASRRLPELLAPAGDWECARAAVENGADAIYFGLEKFNARMRAHNFTEADLPKLMEYLHGRGVKGYVTFNTLVFANELAEAEQYLRTIIAAGVDAAIVQDVGVCRLIRSLSPDFPIHASTQMTVTSAAGVEFARGLGCHLVVLARECSLKEIEKIQSAQAAAGADLVGQSRLPLEVFVHGALCVAYSGQCLTSEALGGRSANRGECAQACRLPYELLSDGSPVPLGDRRYLLSPQDLAGLEVLPGLIQAGVASLKIEGRLKSPEYVANITRIYREALDRAEGSETPGADTAAPQSPSRNPQYEMEMAFSRGLYSGWFRGINNQELVHARFGKKRGVYLGEVSGIRAGRIQIQLQAPLKPGDGVVFDAGHPEQKEEGGRVYEVRNLERASPNTNVAELAFGREDIDFARVQVGNKLWKTSDPELDRLLRRSFAGDEPRFQRPINVEVHGVVGRPLTVIARDDDGHVARAESSVTLAPAEKHPLTEIKLREQLGRLGGTGFKLRTVENSLAPGVMLPVSELNRLRREVVSQLESQRSASRRWTLKPVASAREDRGGNLRAGSRDPRPAECELIVLVRNPGQLEAALRSSVTTLYCEFADPKLYRTAVATVRTTQQTRDRASGLHEPASRLQVFVAPPRIFKTGEEWILRLVRSSEADGYLVRNYDHLGFFAGRRCVGDFSLNVANPLTAEYFLERFGLERVTASYDLNITQLEALLKSAPPEWFEITLHQHMPMFHMEHCVFCAFLSKGTDYTNCGRPCDRHVVGLKDRVGAIHPLTADAGCRNTVFNSRAQTGAEFAGRMIDLGARRFRIEFLDETPDQVLQTIASYQQLLRGGIDGASLWRELKLLNQLGVTRGQMA